MSAERNAWIRNVLGIDVAAVAAGATDAAPGGPPAGFVAMQKCRLDVDRTCKKLAVEIDQFRAAVQKAFEDDAAEEDVLVALADLGELREEMDGRLVDALDDVLESEPDAPDRPRLVAGARKVLQEYAGFINSNAMAKSFQGPTPFGMTLTAIPSLRTSLAALSRELR